MSGAFRSSITSARVDSASAVRSRESSRRSPISFGACRPGCRSGPLRISDPSCCQGAVFISTVSSTLWSESLLEPVACPNHHWPSTWLLIGLLSPSAGRSLARFPVQATGGPHALTALLTRLDTLPLSGRRHPDSFIALGASATCSTKLEHRALMLSGKTQFQLHSTD